MEAIINGKIFTSNEGNPWAEAMVYDEEKIIYVGSGENMPKAETVYDLGGKMVIPGIIDSHTHPGMVSQSAWHIKLPWTTDVGELLAFVKNYANAHPKEEVPFLYFEYYPTSMFGAKGPTKELLDTAVNDRPCLCQDFGEHLHWINSKMLEMMEVTKDTPDPTPGLEMFVRDSEGNPTGWVKEFAWIHFIETLSRNIGWEPPMAMTPPLMKTFFQFLEQHGITAIADGILEGEAQAKSMYELDCQGQFNVYYDGMVRFWSLDDLPGKIKELKRFRKCYSSSRIKYNTMKLFLDGTNESGNSASLNPHINDPTGGNFGEIKMQTEELADCMLLCNREKLDLHIHMVGDRTFRVGCDAVEKAKHLALEFGEPWITQVTFAHCEMIDPADMMRPVELGIMINWSCHWAGGYFGEEALNYFSEEKWRSMYQFNTIIESGGLVAFSSDVTTFYELHRADPFFGMQIAHTRVDPEFPLDPEKYPGSVRPNENAKLPRDILLKGYTLCAAKQLRWEDRMGSLEAGKLANFNVISDDYFQVFEHKIKDISFEAVIFEGKVIFGKLAD